MNFFVVTLFSFFIAVQASPLLAPRAAFDVYSPPIISPNSTSKLCAGQITDVIWYVISSRQKVLRVVAESPMIKGTPPIRLRPQISRMALLSS